MEGTLGYPLQGPSKDKKKARYKLKKPSKKSTLCLKAIDTILFNSSVGQRIYELRSFFQTRSCDELQVYFPKIIQNIVGNPWNNYSGWGLKILTKTSPEAPEIHSFLSPEGPLVLLSYHLMQDPTLEYEYPTEQLPRAIQKQIAEGHCSYILNNKMVHSYEGGPKYVLFNAFELLMYSFCYLNWEIGFPDSNLALMTGVMNDSLYVHIVEEYLHYFFPCSGSLVPEIPSRSPNKESLLFSTSTISSGRGKVEQLMKTPPRHQSRPSMLKESIFSLDQATPAVSKDAAFWGTTEPSMTQNWRSETLITAFVHMWMTVPDDRTGHVQTEEDVRCFFNVEVVKCVRMIVRHLHYFSNSIEEHSIHSMEEFKRNNFPFYQKKLYNYLKYLFNHWPLDHSFRIVYETWLSYIQPWRYVDYEQRRMNSALRYETGDAPVDQRWKPFMKDNLLFYSTFLSKMFNRLIRLDISSQKNALMFFRVAKIYTSHEHIKTMLMEIESPYLCSFDSHGLSISGNFKDFYGHASLKSPHQVDSMKELEGADFVYESIFSPKMRNHAQHLVQLAAVVKKRLDNEVTNLTQGCKNQSFLSRWGLSHDPLFDIQMAEIQAKKRISENLDFCSTQFALFFDISSISGSIDETSASDTSFCPLSCGYSSDTQESSSHESKILSAGEYTETMLIPLGDPDHRLIQSYENTQLVIILASISNFLNYKYGKIIRTLYFEDNWKGKISRAIFAEPTEYQTIQRKVSGKSLRITRYLPPRVYLRGLGLNAMSYLFFILIFICFFFDLSIWKFIFAFALAYGIYVFNHCIFEPKGHVFSLLKRFRKYFDKT